MSAPILLDVGDTSVISIRWNGLGSATITEVSFTLPAPLDYSDPGINNNVAPPITNLTVSGAEHDQVYLCEAEVILSTGETLNRQFTIIGFNH
jgi:hypothetical protein